MMCVTPAINQEAFNRNVRLMKSMHVQKVKRNMPTFDHTVNLAELEENMASRRTSALIRKSVLDRRSLTA